MNSPIVQATVVLALAVIIMTIVALVNLLYPKSFGTLVPWAIATAFMLFFAMMNSLLSLRADSFVQYWQKSMYSYMALALGTGLIAWAFSGVPIAEAESYRWIYLVISIGFIVFLTLVNLMKIIVKYAEKEEWNEPRNRKW